MKDVEIRMRTEEGGVTLELRSLKVDDALALAGSFLEGSDEIVRGAKFVSTHPKLQQKLRDMDRKKLGLKSDAELQALNDAALEAEVPEGSWNKRKCKKRTKDAKLCKRCGAMSPPTPASMYCNGCRLVIYEERNRKSGPNQPKRKKRGEGPAAGDSIVMQAAAHDEKARRKAELAELGRNRIEKEKPKGSKEPERPGHIRNMDEDVAVMPGNVALQEALRTAHSWGAQGFVEHVRMVYGSLPSPDTMIAQSLIKEYDDLVKSGEWD